MNKVKYFVSYMGPGHFNDDQEFMDAAESLHSAMLSFGNRTLRGSDRITTYRENPEGTYVLWYTDTRTDYPCMSEEDYMDVYYAVPERGGYILGDWAYRITLGPRKGVRAEKVS